MLWVVKASTGSQRIAVSPVPGTTRVTIDGPFELETEGVRQRYVLIDMAGIRKRWRVEPVLNSTESSATRWAPGELA